MTYGKVRISGGWKPSSAPRSEWPSPPKETNGYLRVRCNGGLNQQRSAVCNPFLHSSLNFVHGFHGLYDVEHFIQSLRFDVQIVERIPEIHKKWENQEDKSFFSCAPLEMLLLVGIQLML
ncbi:hypothetical protein NC652_037264 [Populus alba x Populus x berolinensis]|nr:hypothetical protein NC652_037264 [Populus alba x Populus x berolinensis]